MQSLGKGNEDISSKLQNIVQWCVVIGITCSPRYELLFILSCTLLCLMIRNNISVRHPLRKSSLLLFLTGIGLYSILTIFSIGYPWGKFFQQFFFISVFILCYGYIFSKIGDPDGFLCKYITICCLLSVVGILEFLIWLPTRIDILSFLYIEPLFYRSFLRIHSWMNESGYLATMLTPAVYLCLSGDSILKEKYGIFLRKKILIVTAFLMTVSTITYVIFTIILLIRFLRSRFLAKLCFSVIVPVYLVCIILYFSSDAARGIVLQKFMETYENILSDTPEDFEKLNLSTYASLSNLWVARHAPLRITGTGLGTHEHNYDQSDYISNFDGYGYNRTDAYSLAIRLYSEFGLIGLCAILYFLLHHLNFRNPANVAVLLLLCCNLIRGGHYFCYGLIFFFFLYVLTDKRHTAAATPTPLSDKDKTYSSSKISGVTAIEIN